MYVFTADMSWQIPVIMTKKSMPLCHWPYVFIWQSAFYTLHRCVFQVVSAGKAVMGSTVRSVAIFVLHHQGCVWHSWRCHQVPPPAAQSCISSLPHSPLLVHWLYQSQVLPTSGFSPHWKKEMECWLQRGKFWKRFFGFYLESFLGNQNYFSLFLEAWTDRNRKKMHTCMNENVFPLPELISNTEVFKGCHHSFESETLATKSV